MVLRYMLVGCFDSWMACIFYWFIRLWMICEFLFDRFLIGYGLLVFRLWLRPFV